MPITRERFTFACESSRSATRALILTTVSGRLSGRASCVSATTRVARSVITPITRSTMTFSPIESFDE